jgi:hypothetical protein
MGDTQRSKGLIFGAILAGNASVIAACGGSNSGATPPQATQTPAPSPSATASAEQSSETVSVGASPVTTSLPAVAGVAATITIPGITNAPAGATAKITLSELTGSYSSKLRRIMRRDGTLSTYSGWEVELFFSFQPDVDGSISASFNIGQTVPWPYWYLDEWTSGQPNCNSLIGPGQLSSGGVLTFGSLTGLSGSPVFESSTGTWQIQYTLIGANAAVNTDPWCVTPSPSPSPSPTISATISPIPTPTLSPTATPTATHSPTPSPTISPTSTPTVSPTVTPATSTPTPSPAPTYGPISVSPSIAMVSTSLSELMTLSQNYNGAPYTGAFSVNLDTCAAFASISVVTNDQFTITAGPTSTNCEMIITGGGGKTDTLTVEIH